MKDNVIIQFIVLVLAVTAGQILLKLGASFLPQAGIAGSVRSVIATI